MYTVLKLLTLQILTEYQLLILMMNQQLTWGVNGMYAFDFATLSAGVESEDPGWYIQLKVSLLV